MPTVGQILVGAKSIARILTALGTGDPVMNVVTLTRDPQTFATGGPFAQPGRWDGKIYVHMTDEVDVNWIRADLLQSAQERWIGVLETQQRTLADLGAASYELIASKAFSTFPAGNYGTTWSVEIPGGCACLIHGVEVGVTEEITETFTADLRATAGGAAIDGIEPVSLTGLVNTAVPIRFLSIPTGNQVHIGVSQDLGSPVRTIAEMPGTIRARIRFGALGIEL